MNIDYRDVAERIAALQNPPANPDSFLAWTGLLL